MKFSILILLLFIGNFASLSAEILSFKSYKVVSRDTLFSISQKFSITTKDIYRWNEKKKKDPRLFVGETLRIPVFKTVAVNKNLNSSGESMSAYSNFKYPLERKSKINLDYSAITYAPHKGILFVNPAKTENVVSIDSGKVVAIDYMDGYGNYIIMQHIGGYYSVYGNLSRVLVIEGQTVSQGARIGNISKEKGLYFQISNKDKPLNPMAVIRNG
ncbi:MAG: peptidoglycan DD-metalloendopeptidase family protein [Leptospira sp.]|jgi:lipoprotein YgeR|nr:peptidoglycan DD-metalloendopeptidase family protein [Leptospira sp.]NCS92799.1 peptidoglycan DD-metalloendopeptidase family protein [Leptospira sp.]